MVLCWFVSSSPVEHWVSWFSRPCCMFQELDCLTIKMKAPWSYETSGTALYKTIILQRQGRLSMKQMTFQLQGPSLVWATYKALGGAINNHLIPNFVFLFIKRAPKIVWASGPTKTGCCPVQRTSFFISELLLHSIVTVCQFCKLSVSFAAQLPILANIES